MNEKKYCECGCGKEVKTWTNGVASSFVRGHHMRKKGYRPPPTGPHYCQCGCGTEIKPNKSNGHISKYIKGHHLKGKTLSLEYRIKRTRDRWGKEPTLSPYLKETFISFDKRMKRWTACITENGKPRSVMHANAVYRQHFGDIPKGMVVHHKNGRCDRISDDRPDNLMLLTDEWNLRFFPVLAKGFGVNEKVVTDTYIKLIDNKTHDDGLFSELCLALIEKARKSKH